MFEHPTLNGYWLPGTGKSKDVVSKEATLKTVERSCDRKSKSSQKKNIP